MYIYIYLFRKRSGGCNLEGVEEIVVSGEAGFKHKHAGIEVEGRGLLTQLLIVHRPLDSVRALLAVTDLVLRGMAPCLLAEAVHDGVEMTLW